MVLRVRLFLAMLAFICQMIRSEMVTIQNGNNEIWLVVIFQASVCLFAKQNAALPQRSNVSKRRKKANWSEAKRETEDAANGLAPTGCRS